MSSARRSCCVLAVGGALALGAAGTALADPAPQPFPTLSTTLSTAEDNGTQEVMSADGHLVLLALTDRPQGYVADVRLQEFAQGPAGQAWPTGVITLPGSTLGGTGLSLSGDAGTLALGILDPKHHRYAVAVFVNDNGTWKRQADLGAGIATYGRNDPQLGTQTELSADGNTLVATAPVQHGPLLGRGHVLVFHRAAGVWSRVADLTTPTALGHRGHFGRAAAVSADGSTVAVRWEVDRGRHTSNSAVVFTAASGWKEQAKLDLGPWVRVGSLALSANGNVLASAGGKTVGSRTVHAAYVFGRTGTTWARTGTFTPVRSTARMAFAGNVALSASGDSLVVSAPRFYGVGAPKKPFGAGYRYVWSGARWNWGGLMQLPTGSNPQGLGDSLSLTADGSRTLLSGASTLHSLDRGYLYEAAS